MVDTSELPGKQITMKYRVQESTQPTLRVQEFIQPTRHVQELYLHDIKHSSRRQQFDLYIQTTTVDL